MDISTKEAHTIAQRRVMQYGQRHGSPLKTAKLLKDHTDFDFEWLIAGPTGSFSFFEKNERTPHDAVNIKFLGTLSAEDLAVQLAEADIYVHTAYIDNSPNSLCEAQIIGIPVITTYVGGIPSLVKNYETGILIPSMNRTCWQWRSLN